MSDRRHDFDALRAFAMLLGVVFHAAAAYDLSEGNWPVVDVNRHQVWDWLGAMLHGFRMPLFFVMSGFFAALLVHRRGVAGFLANRALRILVPLIACVVLLLPINLVLWIGLTQIGAIERLHHSSPEESVWAAAVQNDVEALREQQSIGAAIDLRHSTVGSSPLVLAASYGHNETTRWLLENGAEVNARNRDGTSALHAAVVFGHRQLVDLLLTEGANPLLENGFGRTPREMLDVNPMYGRLVAAVLGSEDPTSRRGGVRYEIESSLKEAEQSSRFGTSERSAVLVDLSGYQFLIHLWFLWFLVIYAIGFGAVCLVVNRFKDRLPTTQAIRPWVSGWRVWLWLLPLTALPMSYMVDGTFGPDSSAALFPRWHVLMCYAVYFLFGALYYCVDDESGRFSRHWGICLMCGALILPFGVATSPSLSGAENLGVTRWLWVACSTIYSWVLIVGFMGLARRLIQREIKIVRYVSDAAYWIYLIHILLLLVIGWVMRDWSLYSGVKILVGCLLTAVIGIVSYRYLVRYTFIGFVLNGRR